MRVTRKPSRIVPDTVEGLEFGCLRPAESHPSSGSKLVVVTYNIRYAVGPRLISGGILRRFGFARPSRRGCLIEANLRRLARTLSDAETMPPADLIALQEADRGTTRAGGRHVARELARLLGMNYVHAPLRPPRGESPKAKQWYLDFEEPVGQLDEGETGLALLGRASLASARRVELPWSDCPWRPRLALAATLPLAEGRLNLFNLHIDPHGRIEARLEQLRAVLAEAPAGEPVALVGDFNTLSRGAGEAVRSLLEGQGFMTPMPTGTPTWRAGLLRLHTDWIFVRGAEVSRWGVVRRRGVSDHWPLWAEVVAGE